MSRTPSLDSFGEIYPGFESDRILLRAWLEDADAEWARTFQEVRESRQYVRRNDEAAARATMQMLVPWIPLDKRRGQGQSLRKK